MRHVKEGWREHVKNSQYNVADGKLHNVVARQCVLPETGEPRSVTLTRYCKRGVSWLLTTHSNN